MPNRRLLLPIVLITLCPVALPAQEHQSKPDHERHSIAVETDSGRYGVGSDRVDPKQLGVAIYPGAKIDTSENDGKGANLSLDWDRESVRLLVQKYVSSDPADKVIAFYRKQLSKFGAVLECRGGKPVGTVESKLKCDEEKNSEVKDDNTVELKAGTENRQHVVGVTSHDRGSKFQVVYVEQTKRGEI